MGDSANKEAVVVVGVSRGLQRKSNAATNPKLRRAGALLTARILAAGQPLLTEHVGKNQWRYDGRVTLNHELWSLFTQFGPRYFFIGYRA